MSAKQRLRESAARVERMRAEGIGGTDPASADPASFHRRATAALKKIHQAGLNETNTVDRDAVTLRLLEAARGDEDGRYKTLLPQRRGPSQLRRDLCGLVILNPEDPRRSTVPAPLPWDSLHDAVRAVSACKNPEKRLDQAYFFARAQNVARLEFAGRQAQHPPLEPRLVNGPTAPYLKSYFTLAASSLCAEAFDESDQRKPYRDAVQGEIVPRGVFIVASGQALKTLFQVAGGLSTGHADFMPAFERMLGRARSFGMDV